MGAAVALHDVAQEAPAEFREAESLEAVVAEFTRYDVPVIGVTGDIGSEADVEAMTRRIEGELGPIDILVNCAGGDIAARGGKPKPNDALGIPLEDVRALLDRNLVGTMIVCRAACPGMIERGNGAVVNIASVAGLRGSDPSVMPTLPYNTSKGAVVNFTRALAATLAEHQITVNCICPGFFPTRMSRGVLERSAERIIARTPLGRLGGDEDLQGIALLFASDASAFITGQVIAVDGGSTAI
jgi:NAD(P)-dependent dehydrogenase (short-subunit alcohol dehydrogenase family)